MKKFSITFCLLLTVVAASLLSCKKDGMNSAIAKNIQYRWERTSSSSTTDYLDGRAVYWTTSQVPPGNFLQFDNDSYFYRISGSSSDKYQYKVDGEKILYLNAGNDRFTTPQYTDTAFITYVDDHLLVLFNRRYYISGAYSYLKQSIDSLKK